MSSTKDVYKVANVSKQLTKTASVFTNLEWRIEDFRKLMRLYQRHQPISSKTFILPQLQAVWQLDVYPRGINEDGYVDFRLRLIGFQGSDGSFSADKDKFGIGQPALCLAFKPGWVRLESSGSVKMEFHRARAWFGLEARSAKVSSERV
ncbi:BTB and MATH domain-containing protein 42 [Ditylenchus destructor]|nr:BTB and MATH domain-containing protein 42 [Ditylenchus destructor]